MKKISKTELQKEALNVMSDSGCATCQKAIASWYSNQYGENEIFQKEMISHWKKVEEEIRNLKKIL